jgi:hypothetical protein
MGDPTGVELRDVTFPGKARAHVVENIRRGFRPHALKRKSFDESNTHRSGLKKVKWNGTEGLSRFSGNGKKSLSAK